MVRVTSRLFVPPVAVGRLTFWGVADLVIGQFRVRNRKTTGGLIVGLCSEFPVKPLGADVRRILIADAVRHERVVRYAYKIFRECAVGSATCEGVFTHRSFGFKPDVL
jgi:hypothetical protein